MSSSETAEDNSAAMGPAGGGGGGGGGGLFAGLSLASSKAEPSPQPSPAAHPAPSSGTTEPVEAAHEPSSSPLVVKRAPVTDKLLGLLGSIDVPSSPPPLSTPRAQQAPTTPTVTMVPVAEKKSPPANITFAKALPPTSPPVKKKHSTIKTPKTPPTTTTTIVTPKSEKINEPAVGVAKAAAEGPPPMPRIEATKDIPEKPSEKDTPTLETKEEKVQDTEQAKSKPVAETDPVASKPAAEEEAFHVVTESEVREAQRRTSSSPRKRPPPPPATVGVVHPDTPIPSCDAALRLLRKFASKTRPKISVDSGGSKSNGILGFFFGPSDADPSLIPYSELMKIIIIGDAEEETTEMEHHEVNAVVESILGGSGDSMSKARLAIAAFCHLLSVWCHASSQPEVQKDPNAMELLAQCMDTGSDLVAHGCVDGVVILIGDGPTQQKYEAAQILSEAVFSADLHSERIELATMKFLLTAGCRTAPSGDAVLRGSHLLQSIRILYHIFLTTPSDSNRTTSRASLQQLVTSVFKRMILTPSSRHGKDGEGFPSQNHRDGFLVLRSMCKLSMRTLSDHSRRIQAHVGLQSSGSNVMWDGATKDGNERRSSDLGRIGEPPRLEHPHNLSSHAVHPVLESKILALELLLYVLQNTDMSGPFLHTSGPQFQYAIRNYLCVSLLKNCTSENTTVVNLSLRLFVPLVRNFRSHLKSEIEAFVTNVFFVILDSKNSTLEHKSLVVVLFEEICSDPQTLAEIFLNYDCDLSAVDLFHRIVNALSRVSKTGLPDEATVSSMSFVAGAGAARMEKMRNENRQLRLDAMRALRQVLASLHASIVEPMRHNGVAVAEGSRSPEIDTPAKPVSPKAASPSPEANGEGKHSLVQIYDSKKKRREEESQVVLRFNQKPAKGIKYASQCGHIDGKDPADVARYLLKNKDVFDKTQTGEYLGREPDYEKGFSLKVLHEYVNIMDFSGMLFDDAIKYFLSGFRLPGEAQKIDRIMEKFAQRYTEQNPLVFPTADAAFILAFSVIMLNTDLHNPAIKEERRMTKEGFIRNNRGICDGKDLPEQLLSDIFDRIKTDPISLKEDDEARERAGETKSPEAGATGIQAALSPAVFFSSHYDEMDRSRESNFQKERDHIVRTTESLLRRKRHGKDDQPKHSARPRAHAKRAAVKYVRTDDTGLRDEYVAPMFEVAWGPALASFSTAMESANGTMGTLVAIATEEELELAAENAAETIEVCLTGFRFAICTAGLAGNATARDAFMLALSRFTQLGAGSLLEFRHIRCVQTLLSLGRDDGELLGNTWEHLFKVLSEVNRYHELFHLMARNDRAAAAAAERRRKRIEEREQRRILREQRRRAIEAGESRDSDENDTDMSESDVDSSDEDIFEEDNEYEYDEDMDAHEIDEANARSVYDGVSESLLDAIYQRSASLSSPSIKDFVFQLCRVSRMEISGYGGHAGSQANTVDLTHIHYRQQHTLLNSGVQGGPDQGHRNQPNIYNLQKLVEVTHYNMDSRPRLVFSDIWATVAGHLTTTALHSNAAVAMYAVDSFRQLSIQYLQREELGGFEFQRKFLKPFEVVMSRSEHVSIKELLLGCVERIILMFGAGEGDGDTPRKHHGTLRSGWRPVLTVLGLAGQDDDETVAQMGFKMLTGQLRQCLSVEKDLGGVDKPRAGVMLAERFVDLVDALLMYVGGPHEKMSLVCIDHLVTLSTFLADKSFALPLVRKRSSYTSPPGQANTSEEASKNNELELWWPILLGLSRSIGDSRKQVRLKSLVTLLGIINQHFFPSELDIEEERASVRQSDVQTLQLIFRGILTPVLEHAEIDARMGPAPPLPEDFERFTTKSPAPVTKDKRNTTWLETTFEHFIDGCIGLCLRSIEVLQDDILVEEVFAMLNSCLQNDSGAMAVRGLRRLHLFVTKDLPDTTVTDDTWATVCHMLRRCLAVRGLPRKHKQAQMNGSANNQQDYTPEPEASTEPDDQGEEDIMEFVAEELVSSDRRYIGSNATAIIGKLLSDEKFSSLMGFRWRIFLTTGLGRAVIEWEEAGALLAQHAAEIEGPSPPSYIETAIFGRKWINRLILQFLAMKEVMESFQTENPSPSIASAQSLVGDQIHSLLTLFLMREASLSTHTGSSAKAPSWEASQQTRVIKLVLELVASLDSMDDTKLYLLSWMSPMLQSCVESSNETIRKNVSKLIQRMNAATNVVTGDGEKDDAPPS